MPSPDRQIGPMQPFAAGHVHDVAVRGSHRDCADRLRGLPVEYRLPRAPVIVRSSRRRRPPGPCRRHSAGPLRPLPPSCARLEMAPPAANADREARLHRRRDPAPILQPQRIQSLIRRRNGAPMESQAAMSYQSPRDKQGYVNRVRDIGRSNRHRGWVYLEKKQPVHTSRDFLTRYVANDADSLKASNWVRFIDRDSESPGVR